MINVSQAQELRRERGALAGRAGEIVTRAARRGDGLTADEAQQVEGLHRDADALRDRIDALEAGDRALGDSAVANLGDTRSRARGGLNDVIKRFGLGGASALSDSERRSLGAGQVQGREALEIAPTDRQRRAVEAFEQRAMSTTDTEGGEFIPEGFWPEVQRALLQAGSVRQAARIIRTATGNDLPVPTVDDTSNSGSLVAENAQVAELDVASADEVLTAYKYTSGLVRVSHELLNDQAINLEGLLAGLLGERIGRITEQHYTTGTGTNQPTGVVTAAAAGVTAAANNAVTFDEFIDLKHSVDPAYRMSRQAGYMFNDSTLAALKKLAVGSGDARPLWQPGVQAGAPDTVDGSRYWINQEMADIGATAISALYGDFSRFWIRDVEDLRLLRLVERFADFDQVAFILFFRTDSRLTTANSIKRLTHPA